MLAYASIFLKSAQKPGIGSPGEGGRGVGENVRSNFNISEYFGNTDKRKKHREKETG